MGGWRAVQVIETRSYKCGFCGDKVSSNKGYRFSENQDGSGKILGGMNICPSCMGPTIFTPNAIQYPAIALGNNVRNVPQDLNDLYEEARECTSTGSYTAAVLCCRKILMHIAVDKGAKKGNKFIEYVDYLSNKGYTPPEGKKWVDHIRSKGNEANHEILLMTLEDARDLIHFSEMLLKFIYEFPAMINEKGTNEVHES